MTDNRFDVQKKIHAAAILAELEGGRIDRIRLLKLLYLADRESLAERGTPIVGGRMAALDNGPLHCEIYDAIKGESSFSLEWGNQFHNEGHSVVLNFIPETRLSDGDVERLKTVFERYKEIDTWSLVEKTHELSEWKAFHRLGSSRIIPLEAILSAVGHSQEDIEELISEAESFEKIMRSHASKTTCAGSN